MDTLRYSIETIDGNTYYGHILEKNDSNILFETQNIGNITIQQIDIKNIIVLNELKFIKDKYWYDVFQSSRYFWNPNGYGLKKGDGYYQNVWILYNEFAYGISDHISIGGGMIPLFLFAGAPTPVWMIPKVSIPVVKDKYNVGVGLLAGAILGLKEENGTFGILYGVNTIGSTDKNLTLGLGWGFAGGEWEDQPIITLSGMIRVGPKGYLMTENFYIDIGDDKPLLLFIVGGRSMVKKLSIDYGLAIPTNISDEFVAAPWLGITIPFTKKPSTEIKK